MQARWQRAALVMVTALWPLGVQAQSSGVSPMAPADKDALFTPIPAAEADLAGLVWKKRPIVVFADTPDDPAFSEQMRALANRWPELDARDVVVITDTTPDPMSDVRRKLRPSGFSMVIMAKDGSVSLRKPLPWSGREVLRSIDKMPLRRDEIRNGAAM